MASCSGGKHQNWSNKCAYVRGLSNSGHLPHFSSSALRFAVDSLLDFLLEEVIEGRCEPALYVCGRRSVFYGPMWSKTISVSAPETGLTARLHH